MGNFFRNVGSVSSTSVVYRKATVTESQSESTRTKQSQNGKVQHFWLLKPDYLLWDLHEKVSRECLSNCSDTVRT